MWSDYDVLLPFFSQMIRNCKTLKIPLPDLLLNFFTPSERKRRGLSHDACATNNKRPDRDRVILGSVKKGGNKGDETERCRAGGGQVLSRRGQRLLYVSPSGSISLSAGERLGQVSAK